MIIHNIKITDFKSCYGSHYFDFDKMKGLIKLSGPIGSGKTTIGEALGIIWGSKRSKQWAAYCMEYKSM